jgi:outer membrane protein OmpA-like peptidoglycan-associated protein
VRTYGRVLVVVALCSWWSPGEANTPICPNGVTVPRGQPCPAVRKACDLAATITFRIGSSEVDSKSAAELDQIAVAYHSARHELLLVSGHAAVGEGRDDLLLSQLRVLNVKEYLISRGVPAGEVRTEAFGSTQPIEGRPPGNRVNARVSVSAQASSGW